MRQGSKVSVKMPKGAPRTGKFVRRETNRGEWLVIKDEKGGEFKARPASVTEL